MTTNVSKTTGKYSESVSKETSPAWLDLVREQVTSLRFGTVQITVHESRVVQVERHEKLRLDQTS